MDRLQKLRPYLILITAWVCVYFSLPYIFLCHDFCTSHKVVADVTYRGQTWQLTRCKPRQQEKQQAANQMADVPTQVERFRYTLRSVTSDAFPQQLVLVAHTPHFYGHLSKLHYDRLRLSPATDIDLGKQLSPETFQQPGPRELEVDLETGQLRVRFGDGKYLAFAPANGGGQQ